MDCDWRCDWCPNLAYFELRRLRWLPKALLQYDRTHPLPPLPYGEVGWDPGAVVSGGALAFYIYAKKRNIGFGAWADIL